MINSEPNVWIEPRTENINNDYERCLSEFGLIKPTQEEATQIWTKKVVKEKQKRGVYEMGSRNELGRIHSELQGIGSSCQAAVIDGVQLAALWQQIAQLTYAVA